ncbi:MAG: hypothetical protein LBV59_05910 [Sphingobacterium sp.]|jgi:hypothetical protein|uniref:hypothetical protein n=1 Tax=Sphingobacterium sp. TaxID=341027 RepID=UPI00284E1285|nr:hypothetical protein [Sphingobacterium sp.]MDR3007449.1 hypothetical protein [Sphingobacterium sp.]
MLSQEIIYQNLHARNFAAIINILHQNGNALNSETSLDFAINLFMDELFKYASNASKIELNELNHDLDILFMCHTQKKYLLNDDQLLKLIHLLYPRVAVEFLYQVAKSFSLDSVCNEIVQSFDNRKMKLEKEKIKYSHQRVQSSENYNVRGKKFETDIRQSDNVYWVKVFLRSSELLDIVAKHIRKLSSVGLVNITQKENGNSDLTIYARRPFSIEETHEEVNLTLENYFSRSPTDPIFKEEVISGISEVAYFQILDYMLKLGVGLEGFRSLAYKMDEERYRDYFVNYLDSLSNNHTATGETFHGDGKSDILIRNREKEVLLVAECKLWNGQIYLSQAIDQLFERYVLWRDGKAALLIFNTKVAGFTKVIETAVETLKTHRLCISFEGQRKETSFSFTFCNIKDNKKLVKLELLLFNFL